MTALRPCPNPWCIATTVPIPTVDSPIRAGGWRIACACGVKTGKCASREAAIETWNTRPGPGVDPAFPADLAEQTVTKLEGLRPRWYARESVGVEIDHALWGSEMDNFGGLFAVIDAYRASERERQRLATEVARWETYLPLNRLIALIDERNKATARADAAEAKIAAQDGGSTDA